MTTHNKSVLAASYSVALRIAQFNEPFSTGEELLKPSFLIIAQEMLGPESVEKFNDISLSEATIQRRVLDMAADIQKQVVEGINNSKCFAIQIDELTESSDDIILICFVRYTQDKYLKEELLCCFNFPRQITSLEVFNAFDEYFQKHGLNWRKCVGISTDRAANLTGYKSELVAKIKEIAHPEVLYTHCMIHREHLFAKKLSTELNAVMNDVIKIIIEIHCQAQHSSLFTKLYESMNPYPLQQAEVRWFLNGKVLASFLEIREEVKQFLRERNSKLEPLLNADWMAKLAYLSDMFSLFNELTISLEVPSTSIFSLRNKMDAFTKELAYFNKRLQQGEIKMFSLLEKFLFGAEVDKKALFNIISQHLSALGEDFNNYYPENEDPRKGNIWITNPFLEDLKSYTLDDCEKEKLIELLSTNATLNSRVKTQSLPIGFWLSLENDYPALSYKAIKLLIVFSNSYLCDKIFSSMSFLQTIYRNNQIDVEAVLHLNETTLLPRITNLVANNQELSD